MRGTFHVTPNLSVLTPTRPSSTSTSEGVRQFPLGVVGTRNPHRQTRMVQAQHRAGVRAVGGDLRSVVQDDVGEEALVAGDKPTAL